MQGDAALVFAGLADRLDGDFTPDPAFADDLRRVRDAAEAQLRAAIAPYDGLVDALAAAMSRDALWVRDITVANSTWGNRLLKVHGPRASLLPAGGGIGQGLAMAIGAAVAATGSSATSRMPVSTVDATSSTSRRPTSPGLPLPAASNTAASGPQTSSRPRSAKHWASADPY